MDPDVGRGSFGLVLRRFRIAARISQEQLAERSSLSVESVSALERGRRRTPYRETVRMLADALQLSPPQRQELEAAAKHPRPRSVNVVKYDSEAEPAPARNAAHVKRESVQGLARPLSSFHDRVDEIRQLTELLSEYRLVSIVGAGGVGKTRVAVEVGWSLLDRFADGVRFVDLASLHDNGVVTRSLLTALEIPNAADEDDAGALIGNLKRRSLLVIVDNCEHVINQVAALVERVLPACPGLRILTTTREPLQVFGERIHRLPPLESPPASADLDAENCYKYPAAALFVERCIAADAGFIFNDALAGTIAKLCRRLDGIALAIELAASRTAVLSPAQILAELDGHFRILTGGSRTALPRQRTMNETIRWSFERLTDAERYLFLRVAIFNSGFNWNAVLAMMGADESAFTTILDDLSSLVNKSLIVSDSTQRVTRYRLLAPMRAYGLEMLARAGQLEEVQRLFAAWGIGFARFAHRAWATHPSSDWSAQVEPEMDNLRAILAWALHEGKDVETGQRLIASTRRVWARLSPAEGKRWIAAAREAIVQTTPAATIAGLALADIHIHISLQQPHQALRAAAWFETLAFHADELDVAEARGFAGIAAIQTGASTEAERPMLESVALYGKRGEAQLLAHGINDMAIAALLRGDLLEARDRFREALRLFEKLANDRGISSVSANLAETEFRAGNIRAAVELCRQALTTSSTGRESRIYLANLAAYLVRLGSYDEAREKARESLMSSDLARADVDVAYPLQHLAAVASLRAGTGLPDEADGRVRAARLIGFVDARLAAFHRLREFTEQQEYDAVLVALRGSLGVVQFDELHDQGERLSEDQAVTEALLI